MSSELRPCLICLEETSDPLPCCSGCMHFPCIVDLIENSLNEGIYPKCPNCRKVWFGVPFEDITAYTEQIERAFETNLVDDLGKEPNINLYMDVNGLVVLEFETIPNAEVDLSNGEIWVNWLG